MTPVYRQRAGISLYKLPLGKALGEVMVLTLCRKLCTWARRCIVSRSDSDRLCFQLSALPAARDEPRDKYVQLTQESQFWQDHSARPSKFERLRALEQQQQEEEAQQKQQQQAHSQQHRPQHQQEQRQREQQEQQQSTGQPDQQQQQPQGAQQAYSWLTWWRRRPQTLATAETAAE